MPYHVSLFWPISHMLRPFRPHVLYTVWNFIKIWIQCKKQKWSITYSLENEFLLFVVYLYFCGLWYCLCVLYWYYFEFFHRYNTHCIVWRTPDVCYLQPLKTQIVNRQFRRKGHADPGLRESYDVIGLFFFEIVRWEQPFRALPFFLCSCTSI